MLDVILGTVIEAQGDINSDGTGTHIVSIIQAEKSKNFLKEYRKKLQAHELLNDKRSLPKKHVVFFAARVYPM